MNEKSAKECDNAFSWMNFKTIFKNYGCCGGDRDDLSASSSGSKKRKMLPPCMKRGHILNKKLERSPIQYDDNKSVASSTHWTDLDDIQLPSDPNIKLTAAYPNNLKAESTIEIDDYFTQEPIDFESLKNITQSGEENNDEKSAISALTKNSKKIHKENPLDRHYRNFKPINKDKVNDNSKIKRTPWQPYEDAQVIEFVSKYGPKWAKIAAALPGRTGKQVRDRYTNKLRPNIKKEEWTKEEDELFISLCKEMGHKWSKIASYLPGRTEGQVKNRYYAQFRKKTQKSDGNDKSSVTFSEKMGSLDQTLDTNDPNGVVARKTLGNVKVEEPISYQNIIESELQMFLQKYIDEGRNQLKEIKETCKAFQPTFSNNAHMTDPTSVISYDLPINNGYQEIAPNQGFSISLNFDLDDSNKMEILGSPVRNSTQEVHNPFNISNQNAMEVLTCEISRGNSFCSGSKSVDDKAVSTPNNCCTGADVLNRCDQLSKRMDSIEFLLVNILRDMREMKFLDNKT